MEDGEVMAWLLETIPEYAKEEERVRWLLASPSALSLASLARVRLSLPLTPRVPHTPLVFVQEPAYPNFGGFAPTAYVPPKPESERKTRLPLHVAAGRYNQSEAVIKALLDAYPDAAKKKGWVRCGRRRRVLCPLLTPHVCVAVCRMGCCRSTMPLRTTSQRR